MKNIFIGVAIGYMFHDVIDHFVKQVSTTVVNATDKAADEAQEKMNESGEGQSA